MTVLALIVVSGFSGLARAQAPQAPPPEREGSAEFAFVGTTGNSSTQTIGLGGEFIYRPSPWESKLKVSYVRNEAEDQLQAQAVVLTLRAQRPIEPRLAFSPSDGSDWRYGNADRPDRQSGSPARCVDYRVTDTFTIAVVQQHTSPDPP